MSAAKFTQERLRQLEEEIATLRRERDQARHDLHAILDHLPAMVGYWDRELHNRFCNHAYRDWFGLSPQEIEGRHISEVLGNELYHLNLPYIEAVLRGEMQTFERTIPGRAGKQTRHSLAHYIPDRDNDGVRGFYVLVSDISAIHEARTALRFSEARYKAIVDDQTDAISRFRPDGVFTYVNDVYCRFFGKTSPSLIGHIWKPVCHIDDLPVVEASLSRLSPEQPVITVENRVYAGDGSLRWMQFVNRGFFEAGQLVEIQSVGRDISALKAAEATMRELLEQLESRVEERTEALRRLTVEATLAEERERRSIARELHDDLGQLLYVARIRLHALGACQNPDELRRQIKHVDELLGSATQRARSLTAQLSPPILDAFGLVPSLSWLADKMHSTYGLQVDVEDDGEEKPLTREQSIILFRAVRELLINVVKHAGCQQAHIDCARQGDAIFLEVADRGVGMDDPTRILGESGGFGLASLRERISYLNGSMSIDSCPGGGVRVRLHLPLSASGI